MLVLSSLDYKLVWDPSILPSELPNTPSMYLNSFQILQIFKKKDHTFSEYRKLYKQLSCIVLVYIKSLCFKCQPPKNHQTLLAQSPPI